MLSSSGNKEYTETLHSSGIISVLFTSLSDFEGYVQASAVAALGEAVTTSDVCSNVQVNMFLVGTVDHAPLQLIKNFIFSCLSFLGKGCNISAKHSVSRYTELPASSCSKGLYCMAEKPILLYCLGAVY